MTPKPLTETDAIRSDIEMTRRRMDETIDALSERVHGRHLLDEVIGFFRSHSDATSDTGARVRDKVSETAGKISESAGTAAQAAINTVKKNPLPILMITAGAAWLTYAMLKGRRSDLEDATDDANEYDPDTHYDRPLEYPDPATSAVGEPVEGMTDQPGSAFESIKEKAAAAKETLSNLSETARDKFQSVKERASEFGSRVRDRASEIGEQVQDRTRQARDRVAQTVDEHPIEVGLGCLAIGVLVGLALPTPEPVNRLAGPTADRLRTRTRDAGRDMIEKGKRVVQAATSAAKQEAQSQGLTFDRMRQGGEATAEPAGETAPDAARLEGTTGSESDR